MKLIIDIPEEAYNILLTEQVLPPHIDVEWLLIHGTPLDDVKAEIETLREGEQQIYGKASWNFVGKCLEIIDKHIGKAESEDV